MTYEDDRSIPGKILEQICAEGFDALSIVSCASLVSVGVEFVRSLKGNQIQ